jgi:hypothetical protein
VKYIKLALLVLLHTTPFVCFSEDNYIYFNGNYLDKIIDSANIQHENLLFDNSLREEWSIYYSKPYINTNIYQYYIEYKDSNIILLTEMVQGTKNVRDYKIIKKVHPETYLAEGPVEVNGKYFDWDITVVVNKKWKGSQFTDDILQAFKINLETKKIDVFYYETIRLFSEI